MERTQHTNRNLWIGLGVVAILLFLALPMFGGMWWGPHHLGAYGARPFGEGAPALWGVGMGFGWLIRLAFFGALVFLLVTLFRRSPYRSEPESTRSDLNSLEILRRRYAAGEITREQYDEMRRVLEPTP